MVTTIQTGNTRESLDPSSAVVQTWEQEFAWTEADMPIKLAARALTVPEGSSLNQQPIFCFETMMKMWYWSCLVYDHRRVHSACLHTSCTVCVAPCSNAYVVAILALGCMAALHTVSLACAVVNSVVAS